MEKMLSLEDRRDNLAQKIQIWEERERTKKKRIERLERELSEERAGLEKIQRTLEAGKKREEELVSLLKGEY